MTARKPTHADRDNTGDGSTSENGGLDNDDAQALIDYLDDVGACSIDELAGWSRLPHVYLKRLLRELEEAGLIESSQGYHEVRITPTTDSDPAIATDGGHVPGDGDSEVEVDLNVGLSAKDLHDVIGNERRRKTIRVLSGVSAMMELSDESCSQYIELGDLTDALVAGNGLGATGDIDRKRRNSVYNSLSQTHLPQLEELGLIEYHDRVQKVKPTPLLQQSAEVLDLIDSVAVRHGPRPGLETFTSVLREGEP
jgi:predicted transcriptional regulator